MAGPNPYQNDYYDQLATYGIVSSSITPYFSDAFMQARGPYLWQYPMAWDALEQLMGQWYCNRLAGGNAVHAAGTDGLVPPTQMGDKKRALGDLMPDESGIPISIQPRLD